MPDIEIKRGYEVLPDNNIRFGIRVINNRGSVISDVEVILDYSEDSFKLQGDKIQKLGTIPPSVPRTAKFILQPKSCIHKDELGDTVLYKDHEWNRQTVTMRPMEVHCVCPFLKEKSMSRVEFLSLSKSGYSAESGVNFENIGAARVVELLSHTCKNRLYKVDDFPVDGGRIIYLAGDAVGEKAYYLLTAVVKEHEGLTQVFLRANSDKDHGLTGFLNETLDNLRHLVVAGEVREIGLIRKEQVINIIDSVVQRTSFGGVDGGASSINIRDSVVQQTGFNKVDEEQKKRDDEERLLREERQRKEEQELIKREREEQQRREAEERKERIIKDQEKQELLKKQKEEQEKQRKEEQERKRRQREEEGIARREKERLEREEEKRKKENEDKRLTEKLELYKKQESERKVREESENKKVKLRQTQEKNISKTAYSPQNRFVNFKEYERGETENKKVQQSQKGSSGKFFAVALLLGIVFLSFWMFSPDGNNDTNIIEPTPVPTPEVTQASTPAPANQKTITNSIGMEFVLIPAGEFDMGSPSNENGRDNDEGPVYSVTISKPFYMGKYEVTQEQWRDVMGNNPSRFRGDNLPVEDVSWNYVQEFIKKLNEKEGINKYRLPSEAEWEYAARAGTTTRYSFGDDEGKLGEYAWYADNSGRKAHNVGQKKPNPWGLYDMHGNVWEWTQDWYHDDYKGAPTDGSAWEGSGASRVNRGGSWGSNARNCRSAYRDDFVPDFRDRNLGFRLLRSPQPLFTLPLHPLPELTQIANKHNGAGVRKPPARSKKMSEGQRKKITL